MSSFTSRLRFAAKLASIHFLISLTIAILTAILVFKIWYPHPFMIIAGGLVMFALIVVIDVVCGPLMTMILSNPKKSRRAMIFDFTVIGLVQLSALIYGLHAVYMARPLYYAFDKDRFEIVSAAQLPQDALQQAESKWQKLPMWGPKLISIDCSSQYQDKLDSVMLSMSGFPPIARPFCWQEFNAQRDLPTIQKAMKPVLLLMNRHPEKKSIIEKAIRKTGLSQEQLFFLPFTNDQVFSWSALLDKDGKIVGYVEAEGFM